MKLTAIKELFNTNKITKAEFIDRMYAVHETLADYRSFLTSSGISKIEVTGGQIIFTSAASHYHNGGLRFFCDIEDKRTTPLEALNFGNYEAEDSEMMYKLIQNHFTVFDIGSNIGWYTNHIAALLTKGTMYAFEPIPETYTKLVNNVGLNRFTNIRLQNLALSDKKETLTFYYSPFMSGASSSQNITGNEAAIQVNCTTSTLDAFVTQHEIAAVDFIKCDVEGAELFVFKGALDTIRKFTPVVFSEMLRKWAAKFGYHPNDIINLFKDCGYDCFIAREGRLVQFSIVDEATAATNFFFLHPEKHAASIASFA